tara:strand:+ start:244 stop:594 length:351 start_codon:yes stop_codon:yes gene_type:complete
MNKNILWLLVIVAGLSFWAYKVFNTAQAYQVAKTAVENQHEITQSIGTYEISYDWWFGVFRALRYGEVQEFEFHLKANEQEAISVVEVVKTDGIWQVTCLKAVKGEYLNKRIIDDC